MNPLFHISFYRTDEKQIKFEKEYIADGFVADFYEYSIYICSWLLILRIVNQKVEIKNQYNIDGTDVIEF